MSHAAEFLGGEKVLSAVSQFAHAERRMLLAFHKPYGVISQFTRDGSGLRTLAEFGFPKGVYPIGRLDGDSEGLLLLSDETALNERLLSPARGHVRCYWAQVERIPSAAVLEKLQRGLTVQGRTTLPCRAWMLASPPDLPPRVPPIRFRKSVPDCWLAIELVEGKNRQVRRMTAAIGHPTLRLVRWQIGSLPLGDLAAGQWRRLTETDRRLALSGPEGGAVKTGGKGDRRAGRASRKTDAHRGTS